MGKLLGMCAWIIVMGSAVRVPRVIYCRRDRRGVGVGNGRGLASERQSIVALPTKSPYLGCADYACVSARDLRTLAYGVALLSHLKRNTTFPLRYSFFSTFA